MARPRVLGALALSLSARLAAAARDPAGDAAAACAALNLTEQLTLMRGFGQIDGYSRNSGCAGVCGRATVRWDNGPQGFGDGTTPGTTTQWPSSLAAAATWDPDLIEAWGVAMGQEFWGKGTNIQEGPGVNVARIQHNGRNFEYMSGEDPVLGSALLPRVVAGIQQNVQSIVKREPAPFLPLRRPEHTGTTRGPFHRGARPIAANCLPPPAPNNSSTDRTRTTPLLHYPAQTTLATRRRRTAAP